MVPGNLQKETLLFAQNSVLTGMLDFIHISSFFWDPGLMTMNWLKVQVLLNQHIEDQL